MNGFVLHRVNQSFLVRCTSYDFCGVAFICGEIVIFTVRDWTSLRDDASINPVISGRA